MNRVQGRFALVLALVAAAALGWWWTSASDLAAANAGAGTRLAILSFGEAETATPCEPVESSQTAPARPR